MRTIFTYTLIKKLAMTLGWGLGLFFLGLYMMPVFDAFNDPQMAEVIEGFVGAIPQEVFAFFGNMEDFASPEGFMSVEYFSYMPLILGFVLTAQAGQLFAGMEEEGLLDIFLAYPISRLKFFFGRNLAMLISLVGVLFLAWLGIAIPLGSSEMDVTRLEMLEAFLPLLAMLICIYGVSLFLTMVLPTRSLGLTAANVLLIFTFFINGFAKMDPSLETLSKFSPFHYYQMAYVWTEGLNLEWFWGLNGIGLLGIVLAGLLFLRREFRVSGEGSWQFSFLPNRKKAESAE
ncbi:MAG: ABC transporter permease subunit [Anaerolineaceae bacterium]|nr:ABC transporter permease subunit [Anaerolineaceae bacterium]